MNNKAIEDLDKAISALIIRGSDLSEQKIAKIIDAMVQAKSIIKDCK